MKVKATGVFFIGECEIQTDRCTAKTPAPITAVKTDPSGAQINVCRQCLDEMIRDGQWEVSGSKIQTRVDLAVYDKSDHPLLVVDVKLAPKVSMTGLRDRATLVRRNLLVHSGILNSSYLMIVYYPTKAYLWVHSDAKQAETEPDYDLDIAEDLQRYESSDYDVLSDHERAEAVVSAWLANVMSTAVTEGAQFEWLAQTGLYDSIKNERLVAHPVALAA